MNKKFINTMVGVGAFAVVAGSLGTIGWYITEAILSGDAVGEIVTIFDELLPEYDLHYTQQSRPGGTYIMSDSMLDKFRNRIIETLGHGPELVALKSVYFATDSKIISDDTQGYFIPGTNMIVLNVELLYKKWLNSRNALNWKEDDFIEIIFQVFTHEYGHHIAYEYFNTYNFASHASSVSTEIYDGSQRSRSNWGEAFIDDFKSMLNYDADVEVETGDGSWQNRSIREIYTSKELFDLANGPYNPKYTDLENFGLEVFWTSTGLKSDDKLNIGVWDSSEAEYESLVLDYYYSMQELFTRKWMQITYDVEYDDLTSSLKPKSIKANGQLETTNGNTWSSYWNDFASYTAYEKQKDTLQPYLADNPFSTDDSSKELYDSYAKVTGQYGGSDISFISSKPYLIDDINIEEGFVTKDTDKWETNIKLLTMGGWINKKYDEVRLYEVDENDNPIEGSYQSYKMLINDSIAMYKTDHTTVAVEASSDDNYDQYSWLLAEEGKDGLVAKYIPNTDFENKVIAFVDNSGDTELIKWDLTIKEDADYGFTSNWRDQTITTKGDNNIYDENGITYHLKLTSSNNAIVKGGIYE